MNEKCTVRRAFVASGQVQGVGFRPFVYRLAHEGGLTGTVGNTSEGVRMEVQGTPEQVQRFGLRLRNELPPLARLTGVEEHDLPLVEDETAFRIVDPDGRTHYFRGLVTSWQNGGLTAGILAVYQVSIAIQSTLITQ